MKQYLAIDIGGTAVKLGIVDEEGRVLSKTERSVCFDNYETPILTTVLKAAKEFLAAQNIPAESLTGIGVSATGQIDSRKGIVAGLGRRREGLHGRHRCHAGDRRRRRHPHRRPPAGRCAGSRR